MERYRVSEVAVHLLLSVHLLLPLDLLYTEKRTIYCFIRFNVASCTFGCELINLIVRLFIQL